MEIEKGKILARGKTGKKFLDSKKGMRNAFLMSIGAFFLSIFVMIELFWANEWGLIEMSSLVLILFPLIVGILGMWAYRPSAWDQLDIIYENGLSALDSPFLPFSEVKMIGEGKVPDRDEKARFIVAVSKDGNWKHYVIYEEADFINDFYEKARQILKQKCPDVPWVQMEWLEWKKKNKKKDGGKK